MLSNNLSKTYLCGGYLRLSKEDGDVAGSETLQSNSIENQKEYIEDYIHSKPEIKIVDFYVDDGYSGVNLYNAETNIDIGTKYLADLIEKYENPKIAIAAYNAGFGNVDKWIAQGVIKEDGSMPSDLMGAFHIEKQKCIYVK